MQLISRGDSRPEAVFLFEPPLFPCRGIATRITVRRAFLFARGRRRNFAEPFLSISLPLPPSPARETRRKRELRRLARGTFNTQHGVRQKHGSWRVVAEPALSSPRATFDRGLSIATGGRRRSWAGKRRIKRSETFKQRLVVRYQRP